VTFPATDCSRARESISVQLDGELPELELDRLETHLRICPKCSLWADQVRDMTLRLRETALEAPAERFVLPRRARRWTVSSAVALASAAAVVATIFVAPARQDASRASLAVVPIPAHTVNARAMRPVYPHPVDFLIPGAPSPATAQGPVRPL
jgi:Putative zinc-finger